MGLPHLGGVMGLTPAYAGNTGLMAFPPIPETAHPRIRGEYTIHTIVPVNVYGSPPHTRGIRGIQRARRPRAGLTPAYAGNTF